MRYSKSIIQSIKREPKLGLQLLLSNKVLKIISVSQVWINDFIIVLTQKGNSWMMLIYIGAKIFQVVWISTSKLFWLFGFFHPINFNLLELQNWMEWCHEMVNEFDFFFYHTNHIWMSKTDIDLRVGGC